jgi:hypothetical protein
MGTGALHVLRQDPAKVGVERQRPLVSSASMMSEDVGPVIDGGPACSGDM